MSQGHLILDPSIDLSSDGDPSDLDYMETSTTASSSAPSSSSDGSMRTLSDASSSGMNRPVSEVYPGDSVSQRQAPSVISESPSVKSLHDVSGLFRTAHGRAFNTQCDLYMLPADGAEHSRQDIQHQILQLMVGSLYMPVDLVKRALAPSPHWETPGILDLGTGSGRWAVEIAYEFPDSHVLGLDLVPPSLKGVPAVPLNCRFEVDDANLSLSHYTNCFNVVHSRAIDPGITHFESFLYNVAQTLRPLGILLLCSGTLQFFDEMKRPFQVVEEGQPGFTWLQRYWAAVYNAYKNVGSEHIDATTHWHRWLLENPNYQNVQTHDIYIPIGPWMDGLDECSKYITELMRWNMIHVSHSYKALLIQDGFPEEIVERWLDASQKELEELRVHAYVRWRYTWAERCPTPWEERLERPMPLEADPRILPDPVKDTSMLSSENGASG